MIFDVKIMKGFRRKARWIADSHKTEIPTSIMYTTTVI